MEAQSILVVEDEESIAEVAALYLARSGYAVSVVHDGHAALRHLTSHSPALIVLDVMLPGLDGLEIARRVRRAGSTPIIFLTARGSEEDRIGGLELGADDYLVKPFSPLELVSRVRAVLRRTTLAPDATASRASPVSPPPLEVGGLRLDPGPRLALVDGREISLTQREFELLYLLAGQPRRVFTRAELLARVWGATEYIDPTTVTVHMRRLREKVEADPSAPRRLQTVWGVGYRFEP